MIAPIREARRRGHAPDNLSAARRVVASVLLGPRRVQAAPPRVGRWLAWAFVVWTAGSVAAYFAWSIWFGLRLD